MAPRTFWKGYLKLSLVTCPVTMEPARTAGETLRFHTVNRETGNRVESQYVDAETGKPVAEDDQAKGYEIEDDRFVILEDEELEAVGLESTRTIDIERFVPREDVGWIWLDRPHLLKPGDKVGEEAFAVIREAMVATGTAAVSRLVLYRREHAVALVPRGRGIVLWTLRYGDEVRPADDYFPEGGEGRGEADAARHRADRRSHRGLERTLPRGHRAGADEEDRRRQEAAPREGGGAGGHGADRRQRCLDHGCAEAERRGGQGQRQRQEREALVRLACAPRLCRNSNGDQRLPVGSGAAEARKSAQGSGVLATRAGAFATVKCAGPISGPSSSQASGIDTGAPGRARVP